jgi:hypothetical protein
LLGHVKSGDEPLVDLDLEQADNSKQEKEADEFANTLIAGKPNIAFEAAYGVDGAQLADLAKKYGAKKQMDPGSVVLMYAQSAKRWGAGVNALKALGQNDGGHDIIRKHVAEAVDLEALSETNQHFLSSLGVIES